MRGACLRLLTSYRTQVVARHASTQGPAGRSAALPPPHLELAAVQQRREVGHVLELGVALREGRAGQAGGAWAAAVAPAPTRGGAFDGKCWRVPLFARTNHAPAPAPATPTPHYTPSPAHSAAPPSGSPPAHLVVGVDKVLNLRLRELAHAQQPGARRDLVAVAVADLRKRGRGSCACGWGGGVQVCVRSEEGGPKVCLNVCMGGWVGGG